MEDRQFIFDDIKHLTKYTFDDNLKEFFELGIESCIKENIQNSLDARLNPNKPVKVDINLDTINKNILPGIDQVLERINVLESGNQYTEEKITNMQNKIKENKINVFTFEDSNTKGLNYIPDDKECDYYIYAYNEGNHYINKNKEIEANRGGSHGIGKIASNAMSYIHMIYFANCDEYNKQIIGGTVYLLQHKYNNKCYMDSGYFAPINREPFINDYKNDIFRKETRGLKIIIPYFRDEFYDINAIIKAVCSNYFLAITRKDLEVTINKDIFINDITIEDYIYNEKYYNQNSQNKKHDYTPISYKTYKTAKPTIINTDGYEFKCYFRYDPEIANGKATFIRDGIGMKIEDRTVYGLSGKSFSAVIIPNNTESDQFLRFLENQSHTKIDTKSIYDKKIKDNYQMIFRNINNEIKKMYNDEHEKNSPIEGEIDTADLLYTIDRDFKQAMQKQVSTVYLNTKSGKERIVKIDGGRKDNEKKSKKKKNKPPIRKNETRSRSGGGKEAYATNYEMEPENVYRVVLPEKEILEFDLSFIANINSYKKCQIVVRAIDGEGKNIKDRKLLNNSYLSILDSNNNNQKKEIRNNVIRNVTIKNKKISLNLITNPSYNNALKFTYEVEV